jgi:hypothetical protein
MKLTTKKVVLLTILALPLLLVLADEYPALRFRGDGQFSGGPVFGYWIRLKAIPLGKLANTPFISEACPTKKCRFSFTPTGRAAAQP